MAEFLRDQKMTPEQVQDFIPTPGSLSTAMYYTEMNPLTGEPVYVAKKGRDKAMQRALMQYKREENYDLVKEALLKSNRRDLIGFGPECLIPPRFIKSSGHRGGSQGRTKLDGGHQKPKGNSLFPQNRAKGKPSNGGAKKAWIKKKNAR